MRSSKLLLSRRKILSGLIAAPFIAGRASGGTLPLLNAGGSAGGGGGGYVAKAVTLPEVFFNRGGLLIGPTDTPKFLLSMWLLNVDTSGNGNSGPGLAGGFPNNYFEPSIFKAAGNVFGTSLSDVDFTDGMVVQSPGDVTGMSWTHFAMNVNTSQADPDKIFQYAIGGVLQSTNYTDNGIPGFDIAIAGTGPGAETDFYVCSAGYCHEILTAGGVADYYLALGQNLDLSVPSNLAKFISAGKPVYLGANGQLPTGTAPTIFGSGDATTFLQPNLGTGGALNIWQSHEFIGAVAAGPCSLPGAIAGQTVLNVQLRSNGANRSSHFESVISVNDQIQQTDDSDLSDTTFAAALPGTLTTASTSPSN